MASDIWLRTILIVRKETRCRHIGYSYRLTARVLLYAPSHRQDNTYHGLCYNSRGALAGTRYSSMGPPREGSILRPIAPWANTLTTELHLTPCSMVSGTLERITQITSKETSCQYYMDHSLWLAARVLLYTLSYRQDSSFHSLCYTIHKALAGSRNSSISTPCRIDPMTHRTMSRCSTTELHLVP